jgi:hypothetical protein
MEFTHDVVTVIVRRQCCEEEGAKDPGKPMSHHEMIQPFKRCAVERYRRKALTLVPHSLAHC